jgi:uncharacterized protein
MNDEMKFFLKVFVPIGALLIILILLISAAYAQSFTCRNGCNVTEYTIINHRDLAYLDERLNRAYRRSGTSRSLQRSWLRLRDRCGSNVRCIRSAYLSRLEDLR